MNLAEKKGSFVFFYLFSFFLFLLYHSRSRQEKQNERAFLRRRNKSTWKRSRMLSLLHDFNPDFQGSRTTWSSSRESRPRCRRVCFSSTRQIPIAGRRVRGLELVDILESLTVDCYFNEFKVRMIATRPRPKYTEKRKGKLKEKNRWNNERKTLEKQGFGRAYGREKSLATRFARIVTTKGCRSRVVGSQRKHG